MAKIEVVVKGYKNDGRELVAEAIEQFLLGQKNANDGSPVTQALRTNDFDVTTKGVRTSKKEEASQS